MAVVSESGTKYPLISRTKSVSWVAKKHTAPFVPAGRMPATALFRPSELRLDASGCGWPQGKAVRNPSTPCGTTVIFSAYACAVLGIAQELFGDGKRSGSCLAMQKRPTKWSGWIARIGKAAGRHRHKT